MAERLALDWAALPWLWPVALLYLCWEACWSAASHALENVEEVFYA